MKILFQGDSITDCGRGVSGGCGYEEHLLGPGYPGLLKSRMICDFPNLGLDFVNRGISGNRIVDLYARWKADCINLKPDILSILIGVNDSWHELGENPNGVEVERAERIYRELLAWTRKELPSCRFVILEPFVAPDYGVGPSLRDEVYARAKYTRKLADEFGAVFIPCQSILDEAIKRGPVDMFSRDGVHPTPAGHQLIADAWYAAARANFPEFA